MSNIIQGSSEGGPKIVQIDLKGFDVPSVLGLGSFKKSPHILQPDKIALFNKIFDDLYQYCETVLGEFVLQKQDYSRYFAMMLEFARSRLQDLYENHSFDLERMIMHISSEMIDDKKKFLPFFLIQMFLLEKGLQRNKSLTKRLLAAKNMSEIDLREVHEHLRRDAQSLFFLSCPYSCSFVTPHPDNVLMHRQPRFVSTEKKWRTKEIITGAIPEYAKALELQAQLDDHIDHTLTATEDSKYMAAMFYHLTEMLPTDGPEIMAFMGNYMTFDIPEGTDPDECYIVTIKRTVGKREMDAFKSLLAAKKLACYPSILRIFIRPTYHYLWRQLLLEDEILRRKVERYPLSPEYKLFRKLFEEYEIAAMLKPEERDKDEPLHPKAPKKKAKDRELLWDFGSWSDLELVNKRDEINAKITRILNGYEKVQDKQKEIEVLSAYVLELSRQIAQRISSVHDIMSSTDVAQYLHMQKRIELDTSLVGLELHEKEQPGYIDCSLILQDGYPAGSLISVSRKMPGEKEYTFVCQDIPLPADGMISIPPETLQHNGKISYTVAFTAPEGKEFAPNQTTKSVTLESKKLLKPAEKIVEIKESHPEELEAESLKAALLILRTYGNVYEQSSMYAKGVVTITIDGQHIGDRRKMKDHHRVWKITDTGEISPTFEGEERSMIVSLADKIRARVKRENEEKEERNKEAQSLSAALIILSEYGDIYEQEGSYESGLVTIQLQDAHIQSVLSAIGEEGSEVREHHRVWTITDAGDIIPIFEGGERSAILSLAEKIRARVKQEQDDVKEMAAKKVIQDIDAEFTALGFSLSEALDTADLKLALNQKIDTFKQKRKNGEAEWNAEMERLSSTCKTAGYRFFTARYENGFPTAVTLSKVNGWSAILTLQPVVSFKLNNPPQKDGQIIRQRIENVLLTFVYNIMKNGDGTLFALDQDTRAKEDLAKLKRDYKRDLRKKKARIIVQKTDGNFLIIRNISRENLEQELGQAQSIHGQGNVALLLRESTYNFHGEHGVIKPRIDKIRDAYDSFSDSDVGVERREILRQRIIKTLVDQNMLKNITVNGCKRDGFIPGSGVDQILTGAVKSFIEKKQSELAEGDIDDAFLSAFIDKLKSGDSPVPVSYVNHRVAYCRPDDVASLIAD